jgi:adhesin transport system outer membrane protein
MTALDIGGRRVKRQAVHALTVLAAAFALSGCLGDTSGPAPSVQRSRSLVADPGVAQSPLISSLLHRQTILAHGSSFDRVAQSVLAASSRGAEAELRAAKLRAEAQSKNWLPTIGPSVSLTSLGQVVAELLVNQVLFDNGKKQAERDFAKSDVEFAAVTLSMDTNDRIYTGLSLYVTAEKAREKAALSSRALVNMTEFERIMAERVRGGVSDASDLNVLRQKLNEINADLSAQSAAANTAIAELNAMAASPLDQLRGISAVGQPDGFATPLTVLLAEAERDRKIAQAKVERAGFLPGLTAGGTVGAKGTKIGLKLQAERMLGLGTGASLKALESTNEAAEAGVGQAEEDANRRLRGLEQKLIALERQELQSSVLTEQARANLNLFQEQFEAGQRSVMDVVGIYENLARNEQDHVGLKYEASLLRLDIARARGALANGSEI